MEKSIYRYGKLKEDIHTRDRESDSWLTIPKGTIGEIYSFTFVPLSITYRLFFNVEKENGKQFTALEYVNVKKLELIK